MNNTIPTYDQLFSLLEYIPQPTNVEKQTADPELLELGEQIAALQEPQQIKKAFDVFEVDVDEDEANYKTKQRLFILRRTLSLFLNHIKQEVPISATVDVDMDAGTFDKIFNQETCTFDFPTERKPRGSDLDRTFELTEDQFIKLYGENLNYRKAVRGNWTMEVLFPVKLHFVYIHNQTQYKSAFRWHSIPIICRDHHNRNVPTINAKQRNDVITKTQKMNKALRNKKL